MSRGWSAADYADAEKAGDIDDEVPPEAGKIDDVDTLTLIKLLRVAYNDDDYDGEWEEKFEETWFYDILSGVSKGETVQRGINGDNESVIKRYTGSRGKKNDLSAYEVIRELESLMVDTPVFQLYLYARQGAGKSNFALFLTEVFERVYQFENWDVEFATNIESAAENNGEKWRHIDCFSDLEDWAEETHRDDYVVRDSGEIADMSNFFEWLENDYDPREHRKKGTQRLLIIDEGSQNLTGHGSDISKGQAIATMLKLARKSNISVIIIGHTGMDLTKDLRRLMLMCHKKSLKQAEFGWRAKEKGSGDVLSIENTLLEVSGIPETSREYWDGESTEWHMDLEGDEGDDSNSDEDLYKLLYELNESGMSYRDIADRIDGLGKTAVGDRVKEYRENSEE